MTDIPDALVERMVALVRFMADGYASVHKSYTEARAIAAELPQPVDPVDPDVLVAREVFAEHAFSPMTKDAILQGRWDDDYAVKVGSACLRIGREQGK